MDAIEYRLRQEKLDEIRIDMLKEQELRTNFDEMVQYILVLFNDKLVLIDKFISNIEQEFDRYGWKLSKEEIEKELNII